MENPSGHKRYVYAAKLIYRLSEAENPEKTTRVTDGAGHATAAFKPVTYGVKTEVLIRLRQRKPEVGSVQRRLRFARDREGGI